jgi:hypothetical protein
VLSSKNFAKYRKNPALNSAENGLTNHEMEVLEKLLKRMDAASIAADEISRRCCV